MTFARFRVLALIIILAAIPWSPQAETLSTDPDVATEAVDPFDVDLEAYREATGPKAFAVSSDDSGFVWGFVDEAESAEEAVRGALIYCVTNATEMGVNAPCQVGPAPLRSPDEGRHLGSGDPASVPGRGVP